MGRGAEGEAEIDRYLIFNTQSTTEVETGRERPCGGGREIRWGEGGKESQTDRDHVREWE